MSTRFLADTAVLTGRSLRHVTRSPDTIVTTLLIPVAVMALFVYVLGGAISTGAPDYVGYLLPGILLITVASGVAYTAVRLYTDLSGGIVERLRSMPIARSAILWAHVLTSLAANLVAALAVVAVALLMGFRTQAGPAAWLGVTGIVTLFTLTLTWIAVAAALAAGSVEGAGAFSYPLIFLPFISSAFVPTDTMPEPVRWFAEHQPVTAIVDSIRDVLDGTPTGGAPWVALAWLVAALVLAWLGALALYRRRTA